MDKNKSRTDLLAAGRKKLQQFRQKKDHKGSSSHGKSSKKSTKSDQQESDVDAASAAAKSIASSFHEGESTSHARSDLGVTDSNSTENPLAHEVDVTTVDPPLMAPAPEQQEAELPPRQLGVDGVDKERENFLIIDAEEAGPVPLTASAVAASEQETEAADVSTSSALFDTIEAGTIMAEMQSVNKENLESPPSQEVMPNMALVQERGDQEADGSGLKQFDRSDEVDLEGDEKLVLPILAGGVTILEQSASGITGVDDSINDTKLIDNPGSVSASAGSLYLSGGNSAPAVSSHEVGGSSHLSHQVSDQLDNTLAGFPNEEKSVMHSVDSGNDWAQEENKVVLEAYNQCSPLEGSFMTKDEAHGRSVELETASSSAVGDGCSVSLLQLKEAVRRLTDDEFRSLCNSRRLVSDTEPGAGSIVQPEIGLRDAFQRLTDELYLTNFSKDVFHLQLTEMIDMQMGVDWQHHQLIDENSLFRESLNKVQEKKEYLSHELSDCKAELMAVTRRGEESENQVRLMEAEIGKFSARAHELQMSLEKSQGDISSLSMELSDCKGLVASLQLENDNLKGTMAVVKENEKKLEEERNSYLTEIEKLSLELADCRSSEAALRAELSNLSETLALVMEERMKLEEEKQSLASANEKVSLELAKCNSSIAALEVEYANQSRNLTLVVEERNKLEEDKEVHIQENVVLYTELVVFQEELKEFTLRLEQLNEENIALCCDLGIHKAKTRDIENKEAHISNTAVQSSKQVESSAIQIGGSENATDDKSSHQIPGKHVGELSSLLLQKQSSDGPAMGPTRELVGEGVFDDSVVLPALKWCVEEAEEVLQNLEKAIEGMHFESTSLKRASSKGSAPAVSKLIQAFESKVHTDEQGADEQPAMGAQSPADPFMSTKEQTEKLRAILQQLGRDAEKAEEKRGFSDARFGELMAEHKALKEHSGSLEAENLELGILYEAVKHYTAGIEAKNNELGVLCQALEEQDYRLRAECDKLGEKASEYQSRVSELLNQLHDLRQSSDEKTSVIEYQLESLQKEANERTLILEQEWSSIISQILKSVGRLDKYNGRSSTTVTVGHLDIINCITDSVNATIKKIDDLQENLDTARAEYKACCNLYSEVNEKLNDLLIRNESASSVLHKIYGDLRKLLMDSCGAVDNPEINNQAGEVLDPMDYSNYKTILDNLENLLAERLHLQSLNDELNLNTVSRANDLEELKKSCLTSDAIQKLIEDVEGTLEPENSKIDLEKSPASRLESLVSLLVQTYKETGKQVNSCQEEFESKVMELTEMREEIHGLNTLNLKFKNEIAVLRESLSKTEEALTIARSELQEKVSELEQSDQRVSSVREKLSIAVAKGKGLVVQRDNLKQSLGETSKELERCSEELHLKDARLHELETKLKTYMEAGERVEALESELSYIRNSATALRESFLLKDSVLQRIEEILEELDLPEHFHSRDIIEKVHWLGRSATVNPSPANDLDQKSSMGGSYSDAGFVVPDAWKEDAALTSTSGDELRRKYEELQHKFYGLAEQNEMLEQSLVERNHLVQRWEELLDRIDMPSNMRSVEPEDRIEWLGTALLEANSDHNSLRQQIANLENYCGLVTADLEESKKRMFDLEGELQTVIREKERTSERLEVLIADHDEILAKTVQLEGENEKLHNEISCLQESLAQKVGNEEHLRSIEGEISRLEDLVRDALQLQDSSAEELVSGEGSTKCLEALLMKLLEHYSTLSSVKTVVDNAADVHHVEEADANLHESGSRGMLLTEDLDLTDLKKDLEDAFRDLIHVKEERDMYMERQKSLVSDIEALDEKVRELQELLGQEEQRSASLREKLNVAVRKGKSVVQQRDSLKQTLDEMNNELEHLKFEINRKEDSIAEYELKIRDFSIYPERIEGLEYERLTLKNRLVETEHLLQQREYTLSSVVQALEEIDFGAEVTVSDPIQKLQEVGKLFHDLKAAVSSSEQESRKSRRAAELLLAELNEVQDRNDAFQEELAKATNELSDISKEKDVAEASKTEALSRLEKLSEGKQKQYSEMMVLKSGVNQLRNGFSDICSLIADFFYKDLEFLHSLETYTQSCLNQKDTSDAVDLPILRAYGGITSHDSESKENILAMDSWSVPGALDSIDDSVILEVSSSIKGSLQDFNMEIDALKEKMHKLSVTLRGKAGSLSNVMEILGRDMASQKRSFEALKRDMTRVESIEKERDMEVVLLRQNYGLLYEACTNAIAEIQRRKAELVRNSLVVGDLTMKSNETANVEGRKTPFSSEEHAKTVADRLIMTLDDFAMTRSEVLEGDLKEMRTTIANLQRELQEKDAQKDRICTALVGQIKQAETVAQNYLVDLQSSKAQVHSMEQQIKLLEEEQRSTEVRVKELHDEQVVATELQDKVRSLSDVIAAKDQEIEALMQALDEEENQMEEFKNRIEELEKVMRQKNLDLENLEASRGKISKRLTITVNKFDELHQLSESLISEVEKLQSHLQDRDAEVSFLRQEVTRCTNEVLVASQMSNKRDVDGIQELLSWIDTVISQIGVHDVHHVDKEFSQVSEYKEILRKKISAIISELEDQRTVVQGRDALLQVERNKLQELVHREEILRKSLREKESQIHMLEGIENLGRANSSTSEIVEVEPVVNKWTVPGPSTTSQVRSLRKGGSDQVAIAVDMEPVDSARLDEDDDKVHGFKSLTKSRIVPRFTRPVSDMVDGLWVSCDRALMRQPTLRLGIIFYWAVLHTFLASFVF